MNLVEVLMKLFGGDLLGKLSGLLGESPDKTKSAIGAALPTVLAGLAGTASTPDGARRLDQAVSGADDSILGNLGGLLGGGNAAPGGGTDVLGSLLGGPGVMGTLSEVLGKFSGLSGGTIGKLLGFLAPIVLGFLKKQKGTLGLDAAGLGSLLASQNSNIAAAMPQGLTQMLGSTPGLGSLGDAAKGLLGSTAQSAGQYGREAAAGAKSGLGWILPLAALALLAFLLWRFMAPATNTATDAVNKATATVQGAADALSEPLTAAKSQVTALFDGTTKAFEGIKDVAGAEAALPNLRDLAAKVDGLDTVLKALPTDGRSAVSSMIKSSFANLQPIVEKVMAIPGVGDKLRPIVEPMLAKLKALASA